MGRKVKIYSADHKTQITMGSLMANKKAIMSYIYDKYGFRVGLIVAMPGKDRNHPMIGWALYNEVPYTSRFHHSLLSLPVYKNLKDIEFFKDKNERAFPIPEVAEYELSYNSKIKLLNLAFKRANTDSNSYYVCKDKALGQTGTDFRAIDSVLVYKSYYEGPMAIFAYEDDSNLIKSIKAAVKKIEYRAWKYYKPQQQ